MKRPFLTHLLLAVAFVAWTQTASALKIPYLNCYLTISPSRLMPMPDGNALVLADESGHVWLWDNRRGQLTRTLSLGGAEKLLPGLDLRTRSIALTSDGRLLALSGRLVKTVTESDGKKVGRYADDARVILWDVPTGEVVRLLPTNCRDVSHLVFTPDGKRLLGRGEGDRAHEGKTAILSWNLSAGDDRPAMTLVPQLSCLALSPDGTTLAWGGGEYRLRPQYSPLTDDSLSPARDIDAAHDAAAILRVAPLSNLVPNQPLRAEHTLATPGRYLSILAFSHDGRWLAGSGPEGNLTLWETGGYTPLWTHPKSDYTRWTFNNFNEYEPWMDFSGDNKLLGFDGTIWHVPTGTLQLPYGANMTPEKPVPSCFARRGRALYSITGGCAIRILDLASLQLPYEEEPPQAFEAAHGLRFLSRHNGDVSGMAFSPDGYSLASWDYVSEGGPESSNLLVWNLAERSYRQALRLRPERMFMLAPGTMEPHWGSLLEREYVAAISPNAAWAAVVVDTAVHLYDLRTGAILRTLSAPSESINANDIGPILISDDGRTVLEQVAEVNAKLHMAENLLWVWDVPSGQLVRKLQPHVMSALSADGGLLISCGMDEISEIDVHTDVVVRSFPIDFDWNEPRIIALSPDGKFAACAGTDRQRSRRSNGYPGEDSSVGVHGLIEIRETATGRLHKTFSYSGRITALAFSPDSSYLAAGNGPLFRATQVPTDYPRVGEVRVWDVVSGQWVGLYRQGGGIAKLAIGIEPLQASFADIGRPPAPANFVVAIADFDTNIKLWNWKANQPVPTQRPGNEAPRSYPAEESPAAGVSAPVIRLAGHTFPVEHLCYSSDGHRLLTVDSDGTVHIWDPTRGEWLRTPFAAPPVLGEIVVLNADAQLLATNGKGQFSNEIWVWDMATGTVRDYFRLADDKVTSLALSRDGALLAAGTAQGVVTIWRVATKEAVREWKITGGAVKGLAFSPAGKILAVAAEDANVGVWQLDANSTAATLPGEGRKIHTLLWSQDGRVLACAGSDNKVETWDVAGRKRIFEFQRPEVAYTGLDYILALSPDGAMIACGGQFFDVASGRLLQSIGLQDRAFGSPPEPLVFSPDGAHIAVGGLDGMVRVWSIKSVSE
jgi:WD40 repeat protein